MFNNRPPRLTKFDLLVFASPESRCTYGLDSISRLRAPKHAWVLQFSDYGLEQSTDASLQQMQAAKENRKNRKKISRWLSERNVHETSIQYAFSCTEPFDAYFGPPNPFSLPLLVDISCAPRGRLLALVEYLARCQAARKLHVYLMYSFVERHASKEEAFSSGIQDVVVVPGFNGKIRLKRDLLILVLGFEGNRAFSIFRRLMPNKTHLILGDSSDQNASSYLERAERNNRGLLRIHGNEKHVMASRDPLLFAREFESFLGEQIEPLRSEYNVYFSCLGTKLQALGSFWALKAHPYIQVLDSIPSLRGIAATGKRETVFADLRRTGLLCAPYNLSDQ